MGRGRDKEGTVPSGLALLLALGAGLGPRDWARARGLAVPPSWAELLDGP